MRTEWEFRFEARDLRFEREHTYDVTPSERVTIGDTDHGLLPCVVKVVPENECERPPGVHQVGKIVVALPLPPDGCDEYAYFLASVTAERLMLASGGDLRVGNGIVLYKRIAETPEEEVAIGERPYGASLRVVEILPTPSFEESTTPLIGEGRIKPALLREFNATRRDSSPVRRFLGFFRILENFVHERDQVSPLKRVLKRNETLRKRFEALSPSESYDAFVDACVDARHRCAHLKKDFGYLDTDPEVQQYLVPRLAILEALARSCVTGA